MEIPSPGILDQLNKLQQQLADLDKAIEDGNKSIQDQRAKRAGLQAQIAPLTQLGKQIADSLDGAKKEGEEGAALLAEATAARDQAVARLRSQLSADSIKVIDDGVAAIDAKIRQSADGVGAAAADAAKLGERLAQARAAVQAADAARAEMVNALRQTPKAIQAAASEVRRLRKDLDDASKAGNLPRSYYLVLELGAALDQLKEECDEKRVSDLIRALNTQSGDLVSARAAEAAAAAAADKKQADLAAAQQALAALKKQRQQRVDELLTDGKPQATTVAPTTQAPRIKAPPVASA